MVKQIAKQPKRISKKEAAQRSAQLASFEKVFIRDNGRAPTIKELIEGTGFTQSACQTWRRQNEKKSPAKRVVTKTEKAKKIIGEVNRIQGGKDYVLINRRNQNKIYINSEVFCKFAGISNGALKARQQVGWYNQKDEEGNLNLSAALVELRQLRKKGSDEQQTKEQLEVEMLKVKLGKEKGELVNRNLMRILLTEIARNAGNIIDNYFASVYKQIPLEVEPKLKEKVMVVIKENLRTLKSKMASLPEIPDHSLFDKAVDDE